MNGSRLKRLLFHPADFFKTFDPENWTLPAAIGGISLLLNMAFTILSGIVITAVGATGVFRIGWLHTGYPGSMVTALLQDMVTLAAIFIAYCLAVHAIVYLSGTRKSPALIIRIMFYSLLPLSVLFAVSSVISLSGITFIHPWDSVQDATVYAPWFIFLSLVSYGLIIAGIIWMLFIAVEGIFRCYDLSRTKSALVVAIPFILIFVLFFPKYLHAVASTVANLFP